MSIGDELVAAADHKFFVVDGPGLIPLDHVNVADATAGLRSLVRQEVNGDRQVRASGRVAELLKRFEFEWETVAEPGHMRFGPAATFVMGAVARYAEGRSRHIADTLGVPFDLIAGVTVLDTAAPALRDYLTLIAATPSLYGEHPYQLQPPRESLRLRQTGCLQKFAMLRQWGPNSITIPRCIHELSDSFRAELTDDLELCFRLRHFTLPEAHLHARSVAESVEQATIVHGSIVDDLKVHVGELAMLISTTAEFAARYEHVLIELAERAESPALLCVSPPGAACQDGVELDVEYKFVDTGGCARELSTFQIDEVISRAFGVATPNEPITTIHCVPVGSVERFVFAAFDRIASLEAGGVRARLPLWMSPTVVRILLPPGADPTGADVTAISRTLTENGIRVDVDDRQLSTDTKIHDARADLVPIQLRVVETGAAISGVVNVDRFEADGETPESLSLAALIGELTGAPDFTETPFGHHRPRRLSDTATGARLVRVE
jgi:threonyl-tRNA synthetase